MSISVQNNLKWSQVVDIYINDIENPSYPDSTSVGGAKQELRNMARLADLYVKSLESRVK